MKKGIAFFKYIGVLCILIYVVFTFVSHLFNTRINPMSNWLSDYGNSLINPSGAWIYNLGCIIVAALLVIFFIGIYQWYRNRLIGRKFVISYICAQISGILSSVFLVLAAVFPLGTHTVLHSAFSMYHMIGTDCFMAFTAIAFWMNRDMKKWIGIFAYFTVIFNIITTNAFSELFVAEWIYLLLFMVYIIVITLNYDRLAQYEIKTDSQDAKGVSGISS